MVLAITARMMKITTNETMRIATTIASVMRDEAELERLLGLGEGLGERVLELARRSRALISAARVGVLDLDDEDADLVGAARRASPSPSR